MGMDMRVCGCVFTCVCVHMCMYIRALHVRMHMCACDLCVCIYIDAFGSECVFYKIVIDNIFEILSV